MILKSVYIKSYKSISDSGNVNIEPNVTCLVGKNESGKTAFLEALYRLNPVPAGYHTDFKELYDYPRRYRATDREKIPETIPIQVVFELEDEDIQHIEENFGSGILRSREVTASKNYNNVSQWNIAINEEVYIRHLITTEGLSRDLLRGCSTVADLRTKIEEIDEPSEEVQALLQQISTLDLQQEVQESIAALAPKFLYFGEYSILPGRFSIPYLQRTTEESLSSGERTALALLKLAGVDSEEFVVDNYEARKAALEAAAVHITDEVFEFWTQNQNLRVEFDADFPVEPENGKQPPFLEVRILNTRHHVTLNFGERSTGFVWFFSFLAYFSEFRGKDEKVILLLDEPGLGLHAAAQSDLLRFIDERLASYHQVIYTAHSPFMVNATELQRVRTVEDEEKEGVDIGTRVSDDVLTVSRDTVFPLQAALGYQLSQTLFIGPDNLVVEGPADILYLQILSGHLRELGRTSLDPRWVIVPAGGIDKIPTFIALLGTQLNLAVLLDSTARGNQRIESMVQRGLLEPSKLFPLSDITGGNEADLEDLFDPGFYLGLLRNFGVGKINVKDLPPGQRIVKRVEQHIGQRYDHYQPAEYLLRNQGSLLPKISEGTLQRFETLFERVNSALS